MRGPQPPAIHLSEREQEALETLVQRHTTGQQVALRGRIILAASQGSNNSEIARQLQVSLDMVRLWRLRWLGLQAIALTDLSVEERLADAPRSGHPVRITAEQVCAIVALACELPVTSGRPLSQWTSRELADEIKQRAIVETISGRHAARLLKKRLETASHPLLADFAR